MSTGSIANIADALAGQLSGVAFKLGEEFVPETRAPPRIVMVPLRDRFSSAQWHPVTSASKRSPKNIGTRIVGVKFHVWAAKASGDTTSYPDIRAVELLVDRLLIAIRNISVGSYTLLDGELQSADAGQLGRLYILTCEFQLPIVPATPTTAQTTWANVNQMTGDIILPSGEVEVVTPPPIP